MRRRHTISYAVGLAVGSIAAAGTASATEGLDYTFAQLEYIVQDVDVFDDDDFIEDFDDGNGLALRGSLEISPRMFLFGEYARTESDVEFGGANIPTIPADEDVQRLNAGVGTHIEIADRTDFVGRLAYTDIDYGDFDIGGTDIGDDFDVSDIGDDESDGFFVDAGVRSQVTDRLDGSIGARYTDIENGGDVGLIANLMYELSDSWSVNLSVDAGDELAQYSLGARWDVPR